MKKIFFVKDVEQRFCNRNLGEYYTDLGTVLCKAMLSAY